MQHITIGGVEFLAYRPEKSASTPALNISTNGTPTFNKPMREALGRKILFFAANDGHKVAVQTTEDEQSFTVPSSGSIKAPGFVQALQAAGVVFPTRYEFYQEGAYWIGSRVTSPPVTPRPEKAAGKPRKRGLKEMLP